MIRRQGINVALAVLVGVVVFFAGQMNGEAHADPGRPIHRAPIPVCAVEDASSGPVPCVWIGSVNGNGRGHSYRVFKRLDAKGDHVFKIITANRAFELAGECDSNGPIYCKGEN